MELTSGYSVLDTVLTSLDNLQMQSVLHVYAHFSIEILVALCQRLCEETLICKVCRKLGNRDNYPEMIIFHSDAKQTCLMHTLRFEDLTALADLFLESDCETPQDSWCCMQIPNQNAFYVEAESAQAEAGKPNKLRYFYWWVFASASPALDSWMMANIVHCDYYVMYSATAWTSFTLLICCLTMFFVKAVIYAMGQHCCAFARCLNPDRDANTESVTEASRRLEGDPFVASADQFQSYTC